MYSSTALPAWSRGPAPARPSPAHRPALSLPHPLWGLQAELGTSAGTSGPQMFSRNSVPPGLLQQSAYRMWQNPEGKVRFLDLIAEPGLEV